MNIFIQKIKKFYLNSNKSRQRFYDGIFEKINLKPRNTFTIPENKIDFKELKDEELVSLNPNKLNFIQGRYISKTTRYNNNVISGFVPFNRDNTKIGIYHFHSINYGIRKTFFAQLTLIDENTLVVDTAILNIPKRSYSVIDTKKIFKYKKGHLCVLEIYHNKITKNHGGHQGHLRFWGIYGNNYCNVHSMPLPEIFIRMRKQVMERRYLPHLNKSNYSFCHYSLEGKVNLKSKNINDISESVMLGVGYTMQFEKAQFGYLFFSLPFYALHQRFLNQ